MTADEIIAYEEGWQRSSICDRVIQSMEADALAAVEAYHEIMTPQQVADARAEQRDRKRLR